MFLQHVCDHITSEQSSHLENHPGLLKEVFGQWGSYNDPSFNQVGKTVNIKQPQLISHWEAWRVEGATRGRPTGECGRGGICRSGWSCCWGWSWHFRNFPGWETLPRAATTQKGWRLKRVPANTLPALKHKNKKTLVHHRVLRIPVGDGHFCLRTRSWGSGLLAL